MLVRCRAAARCAGRCFGLGLIALSLLFPASILQRRRRALPVPVLWVTFGLSLLAHLIALFVYWPEIFPKDKAASGGLGSSIRVQIAPPPRPQAAPAPPELAARAPQPEPPASPAPPRRPPPPVLARKSPAAPPPNQTPPAAVPPQPVTPAPPIDLSQMIEARRRERAASTPVAAVQAPATAAPVSPLEDENARLDRIVAANMGTIKAPTMGHTRPRTGGVFELRRVGIYDGEFLFFGWNRDVNRQLQQLIEVNIGNNPNMQIAVVRRMIVIIRDHEKEDFAWQSPKHSRPITLSARTSDNAGLEDFFMREFFDTGRGPR